MKQNNQKEELFELENNSNKLVFTTINEEKQTVLASELYQFLDLDMSNYARWCKENILNNSFAIADVDVTSFMTRRKVGAVEKDIADFILSIDFAKKLCMVSKSKKGEEIRNYFIEVEKRFKKAKQIVEKPKSEDELILQSMQILMMRVNNLNKEVEKQKKQIERDRPDVEFSKTVKQSKKWRNIGKIAKQLKYPKMGEKNLFKFLAKNKYIMADYKVKRNKKGQLCEYYDNYEPYQRDVESGYFKLVTVPYQKEGQQYDYLKMVCSQKGAFYIKKLLEKHGYRKL